MTSIIVYLRKPHYSASLAFFRIAFGLMLLFSMLRFWSKGWITELYVNPAFHFKYFGFGWIQSWGDYTPLLFFICGLSALLFALGLFYRVAAVLLFLSFTYIELLDATNYLNHYYFVSLVLFLMIFLPANANLALDNRLKPSTARRFVPRWTTGSIRLMLGIIYFYAGLAKLNADWMLDAMPLRLWLPAKNDLPLIGNLFNHTATAYAFSWFGAIYDLSIPFLLLYSRSRAWAYAAVVIFHLMTAVLFPIGMFPYVMIVSALIFFDTAAMDRWFRKLPSGILPVCNNGLDYRFTPNAKKYIGAVFLLFFTLQLLFPFRFLMYPGNLFWTEQGYRFSWRVMLMEKMGYAQFVVKDAVSGEQTGVNNNLFLTRNQEKMMSTQPDFILQYARFLARHYQERGMQKPEVYAQVYVSMNGRRSRLFIDSTIDLSVQEDNFCNKAWILPFEAMKK
ncbi:MAG: HTTM domain-containing protein [Bacteroidetes bacterium 43-16]|nr:MAG: HTTM domain-containing protein [Bacteroidetes bacterium 43-16]